MPKSQSETFAADKRRPHRNATVATDGRGEWPLVITPPTRWHYALEFPVRNRTATTGPVMVSVDMTVLKGEDGVGCRAPHNKYLCETMLAAGEGRRAVTLFIRDFQQCRSVMIRNTSTTGRSVAQIHSISTAPADASVFNPPSLLLPSDTFSGFGTWSGTVPPGFMGDWLGVMTRGDVHSSMLLPEVAKAMEEERGGFYPPPDDVELRLDWEPLLEAIKISGPKFTAVALGAGWGRWIVGGAFAARNSGRDYHIVGVEAEPQHFKWMERHLQDNNIPPERARLIEAAVGSYTGTCWFMVGNATAEYGQSIISDFQYHSKAFQRQLRQTGVRASPMPCVDLPEVFAGLDRIDYLMLDVQGSEAEVLLACPELLDERVAVVNIGTHTDVIERRLRRHFSESGWLCRYDIPMNSKLMARIEGQDPVPFTTGDGVMVWENARLTGRKEVNSFVLPSRVLG